MATSSTSPDVVDRDAPSDDREDTDAEVPPVTVPDSNEASEGGKLKMIVQLVKRCLGVKDIASMRLSLPASLLEPIPNLEFWVYLDRPDLFAAINDSHDPFERMLAVLRFTFSKELKFIRGKVCKPYNSVLGEHFRAHWDVVPVEYPSDPSLPPIQHLHVAAGSPHHHHASLDTSSVLSFQSAKSASAVAGPTKKHVHPPRMTRPVSAGVTTEATTASLAVDTGSGRGAVEGNVRAALSEMSLGDARAGAGVGGPTEVDEDSDDDFQDAQEDEVEVTVEGDDDDEGETLAGTAQGKDNDAEDDSRNSRLRVVFLTEQVSHHPPVSSFYALCPERGIEMCGVDQIAAKVNGTSLRIAPGSFNKGIFIKIKEGTGRGEGETYKITHPLANVNGILRGSFYVTLSDTVIITCSGGKGKEAHRALVEYKEESWLGRPQFAVEGIIHTYDVDGTEHEEWTKIKHVPKSKVVATLNGSWRGVVRWRSTGVSNTANGASSSSKGGAPASQSSSSLGSYLSYRSGSTSTKQTPPSPTRSSMEEHTLIDLSALFPIPKRVRPLHAQLPRESRKLWEDVTVRLMKKEYGDATKFKQTIEQRQRDEAAERKRKGETFVPVYFESDIESGRPALSAEGKRALEEEMKVNVDEL